MERLNSGEKKEYLRNKFEHSQHWSDDMWKSKMAGGGGNKKKYQYCTDPSRQEILYLRALQGHSGRNLIDPSLQDAVFIPNDFFEYIYHIGCAIRLHSVENSGLIPGGQNLSQRQTVFFTSVDPMNPSLFPPPFFPLFFHFFSFFPPPFFSLFSPLFTFPFFLPFFSPLFFLPFFPPPFFHPFFPPFFSFFFFFFFFFLLFFFFFPPFFPPFFSSLFFLPFFSSLFFSPFFFHVT